MIDWRQVEDLEREVVVSILHRAFGVSDITHLPDVIDNVTHDELTERLGFIVSDFGDKLRVLFGWRPDHDASDDNAVGVFRWLMRRYGVKLTYKRGRTADGLTYLYSVDNAEFEAMLSYAAARKAAQETERESRRSEPERDGYIYLVKVLGFDDLYKIGRTKNPKDRMRAFKLNLPMIIEFEKLIKTDDMYHLERYCHYVFRRKRMKGSEFFRLTNHDVNWLKELPDFVYSRDFQLQKRKFAAPLSNVTGTRNTSEVKQSLINLLRTKEVWTRPELQTAMEAFASDEQYGKDLRLIYGWRPTECKAGAALIRRIFPDLLESKRVHQTDGFIRLYWISDNHSLEEIGQ